MKNKKNKKRYNVTLDSVEVKKFTKNIKRLNKRMNSKFTKSSFLNDALKDFNYKYESLI